MKLLCLLLNIGLCAVYCSGQPPLRVAHCPSNEVYDMLLDKKGFIWIAHNLGVSRYDGINFTSFTNPEETSISMTDLVEDNYGRIWCHNFNGQIFYIKDDKMFFFKGYDFTKEHTFPRMMLLGDELVATCSRGLFTCNTATLESHYVTVDEKDTALGMETESLCAINNKLLIYGFGWWYVYNQKEGLRRLKKQDVKLGAMAQKGLLLEPLNFNDTAYVINRPGSAVYGIKLFGNQIYGVTTHQVTSYINSVSTDEGHICINTKTASILAGSKDSIQGLNLCSFIRDRQGNLWLGSLNQGLLVSYKTSKWKTILGANVNNNDCVRWVSKTDGFFVLGSQQGKLNLMATPQTTKINSNYVIPLSKGGIENLQPAGNGYYFICASNKLYILNANTKALHTIDVFFATDIVLNGKFAYAATAGGILLHDFSAFGFKGGERFFEENFPANSLTKTMGFLLYTKQMGRCRALLFDSATNSLLASFKGGLLRIGGGVNTPVKYKGLPLYVSSMAHYQKKIYAATFNTGLFLIDSGIARKITDKTESPLDAIVRIKCCGNHIWLFRTHDIEVLDADKDTFINLTPFPVEASSITDVEEDATGIYLATDHGFYFTTKPANVDVAMAEPTLLYLLVNNIDTVYKKGALLNPNQNNLLFRLAIPVYKNANVLHFKYRLLSDNEAAADIWYYTQDAQRDISFNALKPGNYTIEILAVMYNQVISSKPLVYTFTVGKPWYNSWLFYAAVLLVTICACVALYQYRLYQLVKMEQMRRKISNNLHDDIGSTLSSINVYSQLAKGSYGNETYIDTIQSNTVNVINSLDDLVWNINPKNDTLGQLATRMQMFATPLLQQKGIECIFKIKLTNPTTILQPNVRANIYLLFKEIINNIIKHSACKTTVIYVIQKGKKLRLGVADNGKGFNVNAANQHRNGLRIMVERVKELKGTIEIDSAPAKGTEIKINCYV